MPVMLVYGSDTRSVVLTEEHKLWVYEEKVLRNIFRPDRVRGTAADCRV